MGGLILIGAFLALGYGVQALTHLPLPPNVIGMVLLFAALKLGLVQTAWVEKASHHLLRHMMLFFVPSVVGAAFLASALSGQWIAAVVALVVSTVLSLLVAGWAAHRLLPAEIAVPAHPEMRESLEDMGSTP